VRKVRKLWEKNYRHRPTVTEAPSSQETIDSPSQHVPRKRQKQKQHRKYRTVSEALQETYNLPLPEAANNKFAAYIAMQRESDYSIVPSQYWRRPDIRAKLPTVSIMAIELLAIPAMSAEPERIFSQAGNTLSPRRNRMTEETVESQICLSSWGNAGLIEIGVHKGVERGSQLAEMSMMADGDSLRDDDDDDDEESLFQEDWVEVQSSLTTLTL
jgi:hypothetical protein